MSGVIEEDSALVGKSRSGADSDLAALTEAREEPTERLWNLVARAEDSFPIVLVAGIVIASFAWNARVGLTWAPILPVPTLVLITLAYAVVAGTFSIAWSNRAMVELATYYALWINLSFFAVRFSFLAATLDFPLQDTLFARVDAALGFDWLSWTRMVWSHHFLDGLLELAYASMKAQCLIVVTSLAVWGARGRNREFLTSVIFAYLLTIAIATVLPAFGPYRIHGVNSPWDPILTALRAGSHLPMPDAGIVSFPSFHASMAYLLAMATRGSRFGFVLALMLNGLMFLSAVPIGGHYLIDVLAGCVVGIASLLAAQFAYRRAMPNPL